MKVVVRLHGTDHRAVRHAPGQHEPVKFGVDEKGQIVHWRLRLEQSARHAFLKDGLQRADIEGVFGVILLAIGIKLITTNLGDMIQGL